MCISVDILCYRFIYGGFKMLDCRKLFFSALILCVFSPVSWAADQHSAKGVVNEVKMSSGKLSISHGPIAGLGMGAMTMDFQVFDPAMLEEVSKGHDVAFVLEEAKGGSLVIVEIEDLGASSKAPAADAQQHSHQH